MTMELQKKMHLSIMTDEEIKYLNSLAFDIILKSSISSLVKSDGSVVVKINEASQIKIDEINKMIQHRIESITTIYRID